MLCKIRGSYGSDYEEFRLLGCYVVVTFLRTDVSEERIAVPIIRVTRVGELGRSLALTRNRSPLRRNPANVSSLPIIITQIIQIIHSFEPSVLTIATRRHVPEGDILHSHFCEILKS
jgi:hypothetical protein